ncbi:MAG: 2Fe-2S iron-sulfur cluster binding domain-containing protein [Actinomycetota bacterium]|nr:2Fe-2S iron-sulfur cluster binding domain-containing protein [Actinomycetota bacterium]MDP1877315.1 2Fe-2S iron-sulfur cluster binding domain-containing protein [Actinomycetota bacterium]
MNALTSPPRATVSFRGIDTLVECAPEETILLAGLRHGLALTYDCASGGCGSCRAQLTYGSVRPRWDAATGLSARDRSKGNRILMCQSLPQGHCEVLAPLSDAIPARSEPRPARLRGRLALRESLSADTARFVFDVSEPVIYLPGQYVLLEFPDGVRRAYSMTRSSGETAVTSLELLVRAKPSGAATEWLFERFVPGSDLIIEGPYGKAYAQSPRESPVLCLAGGTGLAPILAIAEELAVHSPERRIDLYVGSRRMADIVFAERLTSLVNAGVRVVSVVETNPDSAHPLLGRTRTGLALDHLADDWPDLALHDIYMAGPAPMIDAALVRLVKDGTARADRIYFDRFLA